MGKKDLEAHNPKILVASKNLTFMKKTLTGLLEQDLKETNSEYSYDKAHNIITIGNVELLLIPDEDESSIYGFSCACFRDGTKIMTLMGEKNIEDITALACLQSIEELNLSGNMISSVLPLMRLETLKLLDLRGNQISEESIRDLRYALQSCEILSDYD